MRNFVEATGIPFFTTPQGRGVIAEDHPRSFPAARSTAFREADVVLVIGARANSMLSFLRAPRFSPTPSSSTSISTARKSATIARSTSASSATPSWCSSSLPPRRPGRFNRQRRERLGRAARREASLEPRAQRAAAAFRQGPDPSVAPVQRGQGRHLARHDPGRRRPRDPQLRAPVDSRSTSPRMQPQRGPARMHGRRHPVRNRREGRAPPISRSWC